MNEERDPLIAAAFAAASEKLITRDFTAEVMTRIDSQRKRAMTLWIAVGVVFALLLSALAAPLQGIVAIMFQALPTSLVQVDDEFIAQLLSPVNSIAGVLGISVVAIHSLYRKIFT